MRTILTFLLGFMLLSPLSAQARYAANAFDLRDDQNHSLLTNRDLRCVELRGKKATFTLNETATRFFYEYTRSNIGKDFKVSLCGEDPLKVKIHSSVYAGKIQVDVTKDDQRSCLKASFKLNTACRDCPVCKQ